MITCYRNMILSKKMNETNIFFKLPKNIFKKGGVNYLSFVSEEIILKCISF